MGRIVVLFLIFLDGNLAKIAVYGGNIAPAPHFSGDARNSYTANEKFEQSAKENTVWCAASGDDIDATC